ncbi:hypothetical protein [Vibrio neonatus]|uniref:hypothetical protein n=1 Tax=Vibrio neonatus TaxID=278860 RepID=UPI0021C2C13C|nr:hypothetical protein [Vibrio neonatus]
MISNEELIFNKLVETYPTSLKEITELSYNDSDGRSFIECEKLGFDFDTVNNINTIEGKQKKERSPDAVFFNKDTLYLVEFKEGTHKKEDIRLKVHEAGSTLFFFCQAYLPDLSRQEFFNLKIKFVLIHRFNPNRGTMFTAAMEQSRTLHNLKNLDGYIIQQNRVMSFPTTILSFLKRITNDDNLSISIHESDSSIKVYP